METILPFDFCAAEMRPTIGYVNNKNHWIILMIKIIKIDGVMTSLLLTCTEDPLPSSLDLWTFTSCEECICSHIFTPGGVLKVPHLVLEIFAFELVAGTLISYMCETCSILTLFHTSLPSWDICFWACCRHTDFLYVWDMFYFNVISYIIAFKMVIFYIIWDLFPNL